MNHWLLEEIDERRCIALEAVNKAKVYRELLGEDIEPEIDLISHVSAH